ncbi:4-hydroxythreonine-4-phosphate dehydrogenase [Caulobacter sp. Root655]|uniref:4-hydroxythreonine-4-phosphate dehydrogenase PdxA n=1 Tax=Caulobacter sp. Root655 TaxID=1736578 RepID=UPI0006F3EEA6|nr:4-hydroxythreonine-4-phosphate dehydrogenase PdxA [Caulobacter sp. Root655]KRA60274.1 4-hydroxythreonine-4-phosphate dehydrogenase [Caulobacter sp. Root655]
MKTTALALSAGDPAGIGPEIIAKAWAALRADGPPFMVVGDAQLLASAGGGVKVRPVVSPVEAIRVFADALPVLDIPLQARVVSGKPSSAYAAQVIRWIETGAGLALSGAVAGLVTAPIAKAPLYDAGFAFPGHTEFLAELTHVGERQPPHGPIMMLAARDLRATLVTIHTPLAAVPAALTIDAIVNAGRVTVEALRTDFGIVAPRLAVAALNPHAGEGGALGGEEAAIIEPAVRILRGLGIDVKGPAPADSLFHAEARATYDAVLCMYHDQALIPVKMLDFWAGVNVTLGLPIVRTSPDHGTGFDIAGRGLARADSLIAAIRLAAEIAERRAMA